MKLSKIDSAIWTGTAPSGVAFSIRQMKSNSRGRKHDYEVWIGAEWFRFETHKTLTAAKTAALSIPPAK